MEDAQPIGEKTSRGTGWGRMFERAVEMEDAIGSATSPGRSTRKQGAECEASYRVHKPASSGSNRTCDEHNHGPANEAPCGLVVPGTTVKPVACSTIVDARARSRDELQSASTHKANNTRTQRISFGRQRCMHAKRVMRCAAEAGASGTSTKDQISPKVNEKQIE